LKNDDDKINIDTDTENIRQHQTVFVSVQNKVIDGLALDMNQVAFQCEVKRNCDVVKVIVNS